MRALVGETAERIFTKLSHVVDIRCYIFGTPYCHARTRQNIAILKKLVHHGRSLYTCANFNELWPTNP